MIPCHKYIYNLYFDNRNENVSLRSDLDSAPLLVSCPQSNLYSPL